MIGFKPDVIWRCIKGQAEINRNARSDARGFAKLPGRPLDTLRTLIRECQMELPAGLPPMASGLFGFLGYDMVRDMERLPDKNPDPIGLPDAIMVRPTLICIFDRLEDSVTMVTPVWPQPGTAARAAYEAAEERLADAISDFERALPVRRDAAGVLDDLPEPKANVSEADFKKMVATCKEYIHAGDAFQIVPSQRFSVPFELPPLSLYRSLRRINPSPFLIFFDYGDFSIVGSSPEILVRLRDNTVTIRPLAGTIRRGATPEEDKRLADKLLADPKEHAEHLMLLDLARNDVGRVAKIGSVRVVEQFTIEKYSHLQHISSHVEGTLEDGLEAIDALKAGFPAGTLSGAPKVRAMEIIDEVEPVRRGIYAGCAGYFAANGSMDTCIMLRTAFVKDNVMYVQAGVGVVADSDLEAEYRESVLKARALVDAAGEAVRFANAANWTAGNTRR
jgi:anthranilate synthase component 1